MKIAGKWIKDGTDLTLNFGSVGITTSSGRTYQLRSAVDGSLYVKDVDAGLDRFAITSSGNVHIPYDATVNGGLEVFGTTTIINVENLSSDKIKIAHADSGDALRIDNTNLGNAIYVNNLSTANALLINQGKVGIGSTIPSSAVDIVNASTSDVFSRTASSASYSEFRTQNDGAVATNYLTMALRGTAATGSVMGQTNAGAGQIVAGSAVTKLVFGTLGSSPLYFGTGGTVKMTIAANGDITFGVISTYNNKISLLSGGGQWYRVGRIAITTADNEALVYGTVMTSAGAANGTHRSEITVRVRQPSPLGSAPYTDFWSVNEDSPFDNDSVTAIITKNDGAATWVDIYKYAPEAGSALIYDLNMWASSSTAVTFAKETGSSAGLGAGTIIKEEMRNTFCESTVDGDFRYTLLTSDADQVVTAGTGGGIAFGDWIGSGYGIMPLAGIKAYKSNAISDNLSGQLHFQTRLDPSTAATRMVIDENGKVGLSTTVPNDRLDLFGTNAAIRFTRNDGLRFGSMFYDGGNLVIKSPLNDTFQIQNSTSTPLVTVLSSGSVGIGTTTTTYFVEVQKNQNADTVLRVRNDTSNTAAQSVLAVSYNSMTQYGALAQHSAGFASVGGQLLASPNCICLFSSGNANGLRLFTLDAYNLYLGTNNTARLSIDSAGNVDIGNGKFTVNVSGASSTALRLYDSYGPADLNVYQAVMDGAEWGWQFDSSQMPAANTGALSFGSGGTQALIIRRSNLVEIKNGLAMTGASSVTADNPANGIVYTIANSHGASGNLGDKILFNNTGVTAWRMGLEAGTDAFVFNGYVAGTYPEFVRITGTGLVGIGTTNPLTKLTVETNSASTFVDLLTLRNPAPNNNTGEALTFRNYYRNARLTAFSSPISSYGGTLMIQTHKTANDNDTPTDWNTGIVMDAAGQVGIGSSIPSAALDVNGTIVGNNGLYITGPIYGSYFQSGLTPYAGATPNLWYPIAKVTIPSQYGSANFAVDFCMDAGCPVSNTYGRASVFLRAKHQNPMSSPWDYCELTATTTSGYLGPSRFVFVKTTDDATKKEGTLYVQNPGLTYTQILYMVKFLNGNSGSASVYPSGTAGVASLPAGTQVLCTAGIYDDYASNVYLSGYLDISQGATQANEYLNTYYSTSGSGTGSVLSLRRTKGNAIGSFSATASGDELGRIAFTGSGASTWYAKQLVYLQVVQTGAGTTIGGNLYFGTTNQDVGPTTKMTLLSSGRLGIGSTQPNQTLEVIGTAYISGNVGIGSIVPASTLDILGAGPITVSQKATTAASYSKHSAFNDTGCELVSQMSGSANSASFFGISKTAGTASAFFVANPAGGTGVTMYIGSNSGGPPGPVYYGVNGTLVMTMLSSGYIGIGSTIPSSDLDILNTSASAYVRVKHSTAGTSNLSRIDVINDAGTLLRLGHFSSTYSSTVLGQAGAGVSALTSSTSTKMLIGTSNAVPVQFGTSNAVQMTILSDGKTGIGITNPSERLVVQDTGSQIAFGDGKGNAGATEPQIKAGVLLVGADSETASNNFIRFGFDSGSNINYIESFQSTAGNPTNGNLYLTTAVSLGIAINTSGNVGIKTASPQGTFHNWGSYVVKITDVISTGVGFGPYTIAADDYFVACNANLGGFTVNLPQASATPKGRMLVIKNVGTSNNVILHPYGGPTGDYIDTLLSDRTLSSMIRMVLVCNGSNTWYIQST